MGRIIEGYWDCEYCGTKKIRGSIRNCPNCLKPRGENVRFYLDETYKAYVSENKSAHINRNPNWLCSYCKSLNPDNTDTCISCGAPRTSSSLNYFQNRKEKENETSTENSNFLNDYSRNSYTTSTYSKSSNSKTSNNFFSKLKKSSFSYDSLRYLIPIILGVLAFILLIFALIPREEEITIKEFSWVYCINVEKFETVEESDWSLPSNATLISSNLELSHYQDVIDHYETKTRQVQKERLVGYEEYVSGYKDLGNGYFEEITSSRPIYETYYEEETYEEPIYRSEPVYRTKYYYKVDKWIFSRVIETSGADKNPYWGKVVLFHNERISSQTETYKITGSDKSGKLQTIMISFEDWKELELEQTVKLKVTLGYGSIVK